MKIKYIVIGVLGLLLILAMTVFFWPKKSPHYVAGPEYFAGRENKYLENEKCDCIGIEKFHPHSMNNFSSTWVCYGVYVNCNTDCYKIIHSENTSDVDWQKITCTEYDEAMRK